MLCENRRRERGRQFYIYNILSIHSSHAVTHMQVECGICLLGLPLLTLVQFFLFSFNLVYLQMWKVWILFLLSEFLEYLGCSRYDYMLMVYASMSMSMVAWRVRRFEYEQYGTQHTTPRSNLLFLQFEKYTRAVHIFSLVLKNNREVLLTTGEHNNTHSLSLSQPHLHIHHILFS